MAENIDVGVDLTAPDADEDELTLRLKANATKRKGRGFAADADRGSDMVAEFESAPASNESTRAQRSVEGWIIFVTGIHEEASEETVTDRFADYGKIKNLRMEMDRRTGFYKGYAFIEYTTYKEALAAVQGANGSQLLGQTIHVDFAFIKGAQTGRGAGGQQNTAGGGRRSTGRRGRSPSPTRAVDF